MGWLNRRAEKTKLSTFERFLATQGDRFEEYAVNRLFVESNDNEDNGDSTTRTITIESRDASEGHRQTLELLQDPHVMTVLQPAFYHPPFTARGDVLHREGADSPWSLYEIKSSMSSSVNKKVPDLAFTYNLAKKSLPSLGNAMIVTVRGGKGRSGKGGRNGEELAPRNLYEVHNLTVAVREEIERLEDPPPSLTSLEYLESVTAYPQPPPPVPLAKCSNCAYFTASCFPEVEGKNSIWEYKRLGGKNFSKMAEKSLLATEADVQMLSATHLKHLKSIKSGAPVLDGGLGKALRAITKDCFYLDFEAVNPLFPLDGSEGNGKPYEQQVTQFSLHYVKRGDYSGEGAIGEEDSEHFEFLIRDVSEYESLVDSLIEKLGEGSGSIIVYSSYEKTSLNKFIKAFPEKREAISKIIRRLVDLEKVVKLVHIPEFVGRTSIKTVLPALDPTYDDAYKRLMATSGIGDGGGASAAMCDVLEGRIEGQEGEEVRSALLKYCRLDSWAMVIVHLEIEKMFKEFGGVGGGGLGEDGGFGGKGKVGEEGGGGGDGYEMLTVEALKGHLRKQNKKVGGRKLELIERLRE
ncbi:hypothetical protein TL16_g09230 [Triparma laevis f. inornata]|uniref:SAP domain-containing protein n=1 Tax=Triparma laevis f. inornata TaxID=1714386 RepID=A0A9W7B0V4_9STRA|nr:hypothetical protein TL16_g09230 [Triparma laevis f. inornata]